MRRQSLLRLSWMLLLLAALTTSNQPDSPTKGEIASTEETGVSDRPLPRTAGHASLLVHELGDVVSGIAGDATTTSSAATGSLSQNELQQLYSTFSFFTDIVSPIVFDLCYSSFESKCLPALYRDEALVLANWSISRSACFSSYCSCLPNGVLLPASGGHAACSYSQPTRQQWCNVIGERCTPLRWECYMSFVQSQLPDDCKDFLNCAAGASVTTKNYLYCISQASLAFPGCSMTDACNLIPAPAEPAVSYSAQNASIVSSSVLTTTIVLACVLSLGLFFRVCIRRSQFHQFGLARGLIRDNDATGGGALPMVPIPRRQIFFFGQIDYGGLVLVDSELPQQQGGSAVFYCSRCRTPVHHPIFPSITMLLPCRCILCPSCATSASSFSTMSFIGERVSGRGRMPCAASGDAESTGPPCVSCQAPVRAALRFSDVFVVDNAEDVSNTGSHLRRPEQGNDVADAAADSKLLQGAEPPLPLSAPARTSNLLRGEDADDSHLCPLCYDQPACVVFMPCGHMASCSACAKQLVAKTNASCHMCRSVICYMIVLDGKTIDAIRMIRPREPSVSSV